MRYVQKLEWWKRVLIAGQILTFPIWYPFAVIYIGINETWRDIPRMFVNAVELIFAREKD